MARGKVKYKDVVGKRNGHLKNVHQKKKFIPRKKFTTNKNITYKRKANDNIRNELNYKKQKIEEPRVENLPSSDSESDNEDDMKKLLNTFSDGLNKKKLLAIESSESETDDDDDDENKEERHKEIIESDIESNGSTSENETIELNEEVSVTYTSDKDVDLKDEENSHRNNDNEANQFDVSPEEESNGDDDIEIDIEVQEEDNENMEDPFIKHVSYELHDSLLESVQNNPMSVDKHTKFWPKLGKICLQIPKCNTILNEENNEFSILEKKTYASSGEAPQEINIKSIKPHELHIKKQICCNLYKANKSNISSPEDIFTPLQGEIFSIINNYQDLYYSERTFSNAEEIRYIYCLHAVNHILKTRLKVIHHNARLSKKDEVPEEFRDQGLVRPKVLIIVPFKDAAYRIIKLLIELILPEDKGNVMNKKRFIEDYTGNELVLPKKNPKPEDYEQTFQGNSSDEFKIGITVTKKSLKLYANFYSSDIIIASPLGLRTVIGAEGEQERDYDFLASIELLILDQTEIFLMQNWDHVIHTLNHLHLQPKESHGTDFSRVRLWSLNGWAKYYRQTLIFSSLVLPEINAIYNRRCLNYAGKVRIANPIEFGSIAQVFVQIPHVFQRFDAQNPGDAIDARFDFFVNKVLAQQKESLMKQTLIFIPNYFDYVRVRNYFKKEDIGFVQICEYSKESKVARARDMFYHGDAHFLLYTERYHFFNRKIIKGIRHLVFYQPPVFPHFYYEMCNLMQEGNMNRKVGSMSNMTVTVIYSKYDIHQLSYVVGTERAAKMYQSDRKVHLMVTGGD